MKNNNIRYLLTCVYLLLWFSLFAQNTAGRLLKNKLTWDIAELVLASDYDPLLQSKDNPDRGLQTMMKMFEKNIGNDIVRQLLTYRSTDQHGDSVLLSGCLYLPKEGEIKGIIVANHYTVCSNKEVPSESLVIESIFCEKGYAVLMADYLGYGITKDRPHPYLHRETGARTVLDLVLQMVPQPETVKKKGCRKKEKQPRFMLAGRELLTDSLILIGYSQGAAVTLALQALIQEQYANQLHISRTFVGGGPYDIASMYDEWVEKDLTSIPAAIPLTILGMDAGENLHLDLSHLFKDSLLAHYDEWILTKKYTLNHIARLMGSRRLSDNMPPSGMDKTDPETHRFYDAMQRQSLLNFKPQTPLYLFHSKDDKWVPFSSSERLAGNIGQSPLLTTDFGNYGNHMNATLRFYKTLFEIL